MRTIINIAAVTLIISVLLSFAACGKNKKKYTWDNYDFYVTEVYEPYRRYENEKTKSVIVSIKMDKDGMPPDVFDANIEEGNILLNGVKPNRMYLYKQDKKTKRMVSVDLTFFMPKDYALNENDLVIK